MTPRSDSGAAGRFGEEYRQGRLLQAESYARGLGAALRRAKHRSEARELLTRALDLAHRCGATTLSEHARQELAAAGARPRKLVLTGVDALTASERRVAEMAAEGLSNKEIAQGPVRDREDGRDPSRPRLPEAGDRLAHRTPGRPGRTDTGP